MIDCPLISSNANRLAKPHRQEPLVRSDPGSCVQSANWQRPRLILRQPRLRNANTGVLNLKNKRNPSGLRPNPQRSFPIDSAHTPRLPP